MKNRCKECSKRVPVRNKQVNFACQREGLCLTCYENAPPIGARLAPIGGGYPSDPSYTPRTLTGSLSENPERAECKECGKAPPTLSGDSLSSRGAKRSGALPKGNSIVSWTARTLGYCRYCYQMNFPRRPDKVRYKPLPEFNGIEFIPGAEVFDPASPFDWYETYMPEKER